MSRNCTIPNTMDMQQRKREKIQKQNIKKLNPKDINVNPEAETFIKKMEEEEKEEYMQ